MSSLRTHKGRRSRPGLYLAMALAAASLLIPALSTAAPNEMTRDEIVVIAKTVPGFSYWWGGSKWSPGASAKGSCTAKAGGSGCPSCTHSGPWGADCSGFVAKAWQIAVPKDLTVAYHPYATMHFASQSTWWTSINRSSAQKADAFNYNTDGAGHIFLYEKGDPWGSVWAWECAGCKPGCKYNLRSVSSSYSVKQRKLLKSPVTTCKPHCEGSVIVDAECGKGDCGKYGSKCVDDNLGVRCVFGMCPNQGSATICLPDGKLGSCKNGALSQSGCGSGEHCVKLSASSAACKPVCPKSCDDGNPCTGDGCDEATGSCTHNASAGACDDGDACTVGDGCSGGQCVSGAAKVCSDGDACNGVEICVGGACKAGTSSACDDGNVCTDDACDTKTGACSHSVAAAACDDGNECTADKCVGSSCHHLLAQGSCGDGSWTCAAGNCTKPATGGSTDADAGSVDGSDAGTLLGADADAGSVDGSDAGTLLGADAAAAAGGVDAGGSGLQRDSADAPETAATDALADDAATTAKRPAPTTFASSQPSGCTATRAVGASTLPSALLLALAMLLLALRRSLFDGKRR